MTAVGDGAVAIAAGRVGRQEGVHQRADGNRAARRTGLFLVALLLVAWATGGGGAGKIGQLLDKVVDTITSKI